MSHESLDEQIRKLKYQIDYLEDYHDGHLSESEDDPRRQWKAFTERLKDLEKEN